MDDFAKIDMFLQSSFSLVLDQILGDGNHFQNLYNFLHQTERQTAGGITSSCL